MAIDKGTYRTDIIETDQGLAKIMGSLMDATKDFAKGIISVHRNEQGDWAFKTDGKYLLASAPIFGNHLITDPYQAGAEFVQEGRNVADAFSEIIGCSAEGVTISNICDWGRRGKEENLKMAIRQGLEDGCREHGFFNAAGESAVLMGRIPDEAILNISGAVTVAIPQGKAKPGAHSIPYKGRTLDVVVFEHHGQYIEERCDGNGNKPRLNMEMRRDGVMCSSDTLAMTRDDIGKKRVTEVANILSVDIAKNSHDPFIQQASMDSFAEEYKVGVWKNMKEGSGIPFAISFSDLTGRMEGYGSLFINPNSTAIARVAEKDFLNPPSPHEGDHVFILRASMNGRSNGWTQLIKDLITYNKGDPDYHLHSASGERLLRGAGKGSCVYHPLFQAAFNFGATKVGHLSGGAYQEKFSDTFIKLGLGGEFVNPLPPFAVHLISRDIHGYDCQTLAGMYNLCGDAWLTVPDRKTMGMTKLLDAYGLKFADMGRLEKMTKPEVFIRFTHPVVDGYARFTQK